MHYFGFLEDTINENGKSVISITANFMSLMPYPARNRIEKTQHVYAVVIIKHLCQRFET